MICRRLSPWWGFHFLFAFCLASCLSLFCYFLSYVCWSSLCFGRNHLCHHINCSCVCVFFLCHQRGSFACLTVVGSACLRLDMIMERDQHPTVIAGCMQTTGSEPRMHTEKHHRTQSAGEPEATILGSKNHLCKFTLS